MKKILLVMALFAGTVMSAEVVDRSESECTRQCSVYSYSFQPDFMNQCKQTETCTVFTWNESSAQCEVKERNVLVTYPIQCRDIPPAY